MKVLLTSNYRIGNETGASYVTDTLSKYLSKENEVYYICLGKKHLIRQVSKNLKIIKIPSIEINNVEIPLLTPGVVFKIQKEVEIFRPDIVHVQNSILISRLAQMWANQKGIPVIATFHHIPTEPIEHLNPKLSDNIIAKIVQDFYVETSLKSFLQNIDAVIALNVFQVRSIKKIDKKIKIEVINNGLDLSHFKSIKRSRKIKGEINFIFLGSYIERKNQEFLVKAFKYLPKKYKLHCYGKILPDNNYYKKLLLYKPNNVFLHNFDRNIIKLLKNSDFFISTSVKEVQSLAVIQALAAGLPVIGLANETISELINNTNGLKLDKNISSKKFAESVYEFVRKCEYETITKNAKKTSEKFDIKSVVTRIEKVYKLIGLS